MKTYKEKRALAEELLRAAIADRWPHEDQDAFIFEAIIDATLSFAAEREAEAIEECARACRSGDFNHSEGLIRNRCAEIIRALRSPAAKEEHAGVAQLVEQTPGGALRPDSCAGSSPAPSSIPTPSSVGWTRTPPTDVTAPCWMRPIYGIPREFVGVPCSTQNMALYEYWPGSDARAEETSRNARDDAERAAGYDNGLHEAARLADKRAKECRASATSALAGDNLVTAASAKTRADTLEGIAFEIKALSAAPAVQHGSLDIVMTVLPRPHGEFVEAEVAARGAHAAPPSREALVERARRWIANRWRDDLPADVLEPIAQDWATRMVFVLRSVQAAQTPVRAADDCGECAACVAQEAVERLGRKETT